MSCTLGATLGAALDDVGARACAAYFRILVVQMMFKFSLCLLFAALFLALPIMPPAFAQEGGDASNPAAGQPVTFEIKSYAVEGNTLLSEDSIGERLAAYIGQEKTATDVESAREALENFYHDMGYPSVLINIPEQTVENGVVTLEAVEGKIRKVRVTGNQYVTMEKIRSELPSFATGEIPYIPRLQKEISKLNRNPDLKVEPKWVQTDNPEELDVDLAVEDKLPFHGSLELNNRASADTTELRLSAMLRYDNLWQKDHSISVQYQTSPMDLSEVQVVAASYVLPAPWRADDRIALYGLWADSETAFGEGFKTVGKGSVVGMRYVMPLIPYKGYFHNLTVGLDYKSFKDALGYESDSASSDNTSVRYLPLSLAYTGFLPDKWGYTQFSAGVNMAFRGLVTKQEEFEAKRYRAKGDYMYATAGVERRHKLPGGASLYVKVDGQVSNQPLVSNEEYAAGGMDSVRGYKESEALGDNAIHATLELAGPDISRKIGIVKNLQIVPYVFYDYVALEVNNPLPEQDKRSVLQSAGLGLRGKVSESVDYDVGFGVPFEETEHTKKMNLGMFFKVKYSF